MPIYGYGVLSAPWTIKKEIEKDKLIKFRKMVRDAKRSFTYYNDAVFCSSIKDNIEMKELYIASYDISKTNMPVGTYQLYMEALIQEANTIMSSNKKYKNYKFDIMGNWQIGKIILMEKK